MKHTTTVTLVTVALVVISTCALVGLVSAQAVTETEDTFEDGDVDGWSTDGNEGPQISTESVQGSYSLADHTDTTGSEITTWDEGPAISMQDSFMIEGVVQPTWVDEELQIRLGLSSGQEDEEGENAFLLFGLSETYLGTHATASPGSETLPSFQDRWARFKIQSDEGSDTLVAKVWEYGTGEPSEFQLEEDFSGVAGEFVIDTGGGESTQRVAYLDSVRITGQEISDPSLNIDTTNYLNHGDRHPITVELEEFDVTRGHNVTTDVTNESTITIDDTDGLTLDSATNEIVATENESFNDVVQITAEYDGRQTFKNVTVASPTVDNLEILPGTWRFAALIMDGTIQVILIALGMGIAATRAASSFAGLGTMQMILLIGWFLGFVGTGIAGLSLFAALFIGLNLAANIDYAVSR